MQPYTPPPESVAADEASWPAYPLVSPAKFIILCIFSLGLYNLWWQYKTWRFFKQWQQTDIWPVPRAIFSLFTANDLLKTINQFARYVSDYTPLPNTTGLVTGYVILNLLARLPDPLWLVSAGAFGFMVPGYRAFREAMLQAPAFGGRDRENFSAGHLVLIALGIVAWSLILVGLSIPD